MPIQKLEVHNGKITFLELKNLSREFDVESIHTLDLSDRGLNDLTELGYCVGLERLDLSNNRLCRLQWIQDLKLLVHLDVSSNSLSSLESLRNLISLKYLKASGNVISAFDSLLCLQHLPLLHQFYLKDSDGLSNPICGTTSYRDYLIQLLPQISFLDGEKIRGPGAAFFDIVRALTQKEPETDSSKEQKEGSASKSSSRPSLIEVPLLGEGSRDTCKELVEEHLAEINIRSHADDLIDEAVLKFSRLLSECNELCENSQDKIEWARRKMATN